MYSLASTNQHAGHVLLAPLPGTAISALAFVPASMQLLVSNPQKREETVSRLIKTLPLAWPVEL